MRLRQPCAASASSHHYWLCALPARQFDRDDAAHSREVPRVDPAGMGLDGRSTEREAETETAAIAAALLEGAEQLFDVPGRQPAAFVLDFEQGAFSIRPHA